MTDQEWFEHDMEYFTQLSANYGESLTDYLELKSNQNTFSFRVAALSYQSPDMNKLLYKLDGYDTEWYAAGKIPITYSNLPYRTYTLMVKGANSDGVWNPEMRMLKIRILPPFYLSVWAYVFYVLLAVGLLFGLITYFRRRTLTKHRYEMEKFEQKKERELYMAKIDFFTNVAHEIRTPLTLIKSPLESILKDNVLSDEVKVELEIMDQNAQRLLNLVNQLLDFRKTENKGFKLNPEECNLCGLMQFTCKRFTALAKQRGVNLTCQVPEKEVWASVDKEALTKIISNLLTNALKYGKSFARFQLTVDEKEEHFRVTASNDGKIIPLDMREEIFRPFVRYRDGKNIVQGTGIGLALVKNLTVLHEGKIEVKSKLNEGTVFQLRLVAANTYPAALHRDNEKEGSQDTLSQPPAFNHGATDNTRLVILIVEDNKDILDYIADSFTDLYEVKTAHNGKEGMEIALECIPDIIVSDIMMPVMDGITLCKQLKNDIRTSHIPIILLTAKDTLSDKEEGYQSGADSYLTKPFSASLLHSRINNLLAQRRRLFERYSSITVPQEQEKGLEEKHLILTNSLNKIDQEFLEKITHVITENLSSTETIDISFLSSHLCMSNSTLYRKVKALTGMSTNEYIRKIKMRFAEKMLLEGKYNISEIAFKVGINSTVYFRQCFKEEFGITPSEYLKKIKKG